MPPKAPKAGAKKAAAKPAASPEPPPPARSPSPEKLSVFDAETNLNFVEDEDWASLAENATNPTIAKVLEAAQLLLGAEDAAGGGGDVAPLLAALRALGPRAGQLAKAKAALEAMDLGKLQEKPSASAKAEPKVAAKSAKAKAKAPAAPPPLPGAPAVLALAQLIEAYVAERESVQKYDMEWQPVPFRQLYRSLQRALLARQHACLLCCSARAAAAAKLHCQLAGSVIFDLYELQMRMNLCKSLSLERARLELHHALKEAMSSGKRLVLLLGSSPLNLRHFCDSRVPLEIFDFEKLEEVGKSLGLEVNPSFQVVLLLQLPKTKAEKQLAQLLPFDDLAVLVLEETSLPALASLAAAEKAAPCLRSGLELLVLEPEKREVLEETSEDPGINSEDFEYLENFGPDWEERWSLGPADQDENGKEIRKGLITAKLVKYPANPKDAKSCLQLMGGATNAPCTGIWTSFSPLIRPTEVEFEFTMNGKVDMPNACVVFTEKPFEGALPDCTVGLQFTVRGGMQLCGGGGNLVRISNDGKIQNDKWNKVLMQIDWTDKVVVAQVDTRGKGYAPAIQTVPFRDPSCMGFGALFIYNTDTQATCWFTSLRVKQSKDMLLDTDALAARRDLAERLKQREYQMAVDADMEVGMKMGAIKSTSCHGMNLAMEQAANNASSKAMG
ncbi:unnamed protein product [Effrenium voratum]|uniref:Uncharacterized protein n=1 Tax=Effrenium voratum TaxID=2562239 RepID=A0AA36HL73_9DINO|nr:unnamed protein product [Effrenium voratum]